MPDSGVPEVQRIVPAVSGGRSVPGVPCPWCHGSGMVHEQVAQVHDDPTGENDG